SGQLPARRARPRRLACIPVAREGPLAAGPRYVVTAGFDPLRDEGKAYAERLMQAGVDVTYECFEGQIHGFLPMAGRIAAAHHAHYRIGQMLRLRFGTFPIVRP